MSISFDELDRQIALWKPTLGAIDPWRELTEDEIDALYVERPDSPLGAILIDLLSGDGEHGAACCVLCGARGSGKTTELLRLRHELRERRCVVYTDVGAVLPDEAGTLAVLVLLGAALLRALDDWTEGSDGVWEGFVQALGSFGVSAEALSRLVQVVAPLVGLLRPDLAADAAVATQVAKAVPAARQAATEVRELLRRDGLEGRLPRGREDEARAVVAAVNDILAELERASGRSPLVVIEGLDKLATPESVRLALADIDLLVSLRVALVISGPTHMQYDLGLHGLHVQGGIRFHTLPNAPVRTRDSDGAPIENRAGINFLTEIFERRMKPLGAGARPFAGGVVADAARMSSGIVRDFLLLLEGAGKRALSEGRDAVGAGDLQAAVRGARIERQGFLRESHQTLLRRVQQKGTLPTGEDSDVLLYENFIVCYRNGDLWYEPHALLAGYVRRLAD